MCSGVVIVGFLYFSQFPSRRKGMDPVWLPQTKEEVEYGKTTIKMFRGPDSALVNEKEYRQRYPFVPLLDPLPNFIPNHPPGGPVFSSN